MDPSSANDLLLLAGSAVILAALVFLMYRSATAREWTVLSQKEKAEMRKRSERSSP